MLTSRCFKTDRWSPLLQDFIQYLMCYFTKTKERILQSQIACHTFLCLSPPRPMWNWLMETRDMPKELGLFYVAFLTVRLYIKLDQFIIIQVTLPTLYHQVPSNLILVFKILHLNDFNKVTMYKRFRCKLLKTNRKLDGNWWYTFGRVTWTIINCSNWINNQPVRKAT